MSITIPAEEISFHPASYCDPKGRVFSWQGEIYRALTEAGAAACRRLFESGVAARLMEKGWLVETELTSQRFEGYPLIVKHRRLPFVSYAYEWCGQMLKDAALLAVDIELELAPHGLTLADPTTLNTLFDGCRPVYVDFCSIVLDDENHNKLWEGYEHFFRSYFFRPLLLRAHGYDQIARALSRDNHHYIHEADMLALIGRFPSAMWARQTVHRVASAARRVVAQLRNPPAQRRPALPGSTGQGPQVILAQRLRYLQRVRREVEDIALPYGQGRPPAEDSSADPSFVPSGAWTPKQRLVHRVLSDLRPSSVLDLGSGRGWYAQLAAHLGARAVALDKDEMQITQCYQDARRHQLSVLPLVMDIRYPSSAHGRCNAEFPPASERLRCEMVLALGSTHAFAAGKHFTFDQMSRTFAMFSQRWLLAEFVSPDDPVITAMRANGYCLWYSLENFTASLRRQFRDIRVLDEPPGGSVWLLCEK
jgi:SAM-dependent methyltransferase